MLSHIIESNASPPIQERVKAYFGKVAAAEAVPEGASDIGVHQPASEA
jgi:hypothetical protein